MNTALLIIDVQNDYFSNGKCELFQSESALKVIKELLSRFRERGLPIYFIQHIADREAAFFVPGTFGVDIHEQIRPLSSEKVIVKRVPNSFSGTNLQAELRKSSITELVVCGMMTHMCVDTTVRAAKDLGYSVTLISDACTTKELEWQGTKFLADTVQNVYLASLNQKFADVITSKDYFDRADSFFNGRNAQKPRYF